MSSNSNNLAAYIWSLADLLRGDFKQSQYGRIILPFTILRRLECVLEARKQKVLDEARKLEAVTGLEEKAREKFLLRAARQSFYNTSPMDLSKLGSTDIKSAAAAREDPGRRSHRSELGRAQPLPPVEDQAAGSQTGQGGGGHRYPCGRRPRYGQGQEQGRRVAVEDHHRLNELFVTDGLTDNDLINYAYAIRDKVSENETAMHQIANNSAEQAMLGDFPGALDEAVMDSSDAHQSQMMQYLNSKELQAGFRRVVFDMLLAKRAEGAEARGSEGL